MSNANHVHTDAHPAKLEATEARQGRWGRHVFWVLVASTLLAAVVLFGSWAMRANDLAVADGKETPGPAPAVSNDVPVPAQPVAPTATPQ
ncbi:MAG: hypothetical protein ACK4RV_14500 [Caulobacter sp.]